MAIFNETDNIAVTERIHHRLDKAGLLIAQFGGSVDRTNAIRGIIGAIEIDVVDLVPEGTPILDLRQDLQARVEQIFSIDPRLPSAPADRFDGASDTASDVSSLSDSIDEEDIEGMEVEVEEVFTDAGIIDNEDDKIRKAQRIADVINLNLKSGGNRIEPNAICNILNSSQPYNIAYILQAIRGLGFHNFEAASMAILQDPDIYLHIMPHEDAPGSDHESHDGHYQLADDNSSNNDSEEDDDVLSGDHWQSQEEHDKSRKLLKEAVKKNGWHPSGHEPQDHETIEPHPRKPGRWIIKFRRELPNGRVYEQEDLLPERNMLAQTPAPIAKADRDERKGHPNYIVLPIGASIPKFSTTEKSPWKKDGKFGYKRFSKKHKGWMRCVPKLILRKFEIGTNRYLEQFRWGTQWDIFDNDKHAGQFDINHKDHWQEVNKWIAVIRAAWDGTFTKREARKTWKQEEMVALYGYFNNLIQTKGLVVAVRDWKATDAAEAINKAMQAIDSNASNRSIDAIHAMAERDTRESWDPDRGIKDWIVIGKELGQWLEEGRANNKRYMIPESVLKPASALNTATVEGTLSGAAQTQRNKQRMLELGLDPSVVIGSKSKVKVTDKSKPSTKFKFTYRVNDVLHVYPKDTPKDTPKRAASEEEVSDTEEGRSAKRRRTK